MIMNQILLAATPQLQTTDNLCALIFPNVCSEANWPPVDQAAPEIQYRSLADTEKHSIMTIQSRRWHLKLKVQVR